MTPTTTLRERTARTPHTPASAGRRRLAWALPVLAVVLALLAVGVAAATTPVAATFVRVLTWAAVMGGAMVAPLVAVVAVDRLAD